VEAEDRGADRALILSGRHPVLEALRSRARPIEEVLVEAEARGRHADILALARQGGIRVSRAPRAALTALTGSGHHQGVVARVAPREYAELEDLLSIPGTRGEPDLFLALDQVQDPGNVGNLVRTAEALGVHGVLVPRHQAAGLTPHVVRAAAGALEYLPVARVGNLAQALERLKREGCWVVGAVAEGRDAQAPRLPQAPQAPQVQQAPWAVDLRGPLALVLGSEGRGLRPLVARTCDVLVSIPLAGRVGSLNVAAAGAALLYEVRRQRQAPAPGGGPRGAPAWGRQELS
jgi:23S rRNA (guanosine2251-2'-O)-methyltransferase